MHRRDSTLHLQINRNFCSVSRKITLPLTSKKIVISLPNINIRYGNELFKSSLVGKILRICNFGLDHSNSIDLYIFGYEKYTM